MKNISNYAIVTDISCNQERNGVEKLLKGFGFRVPCSVFLVPCSGYQKVSLNVAAANLANYLRTEYTVFLALRNRVKKCGYRTKCPGGHPTWSPLRGQVIWWAGGLQTPCLFAFNLLNPLISAIRHFGSDKNNEEKLKNRLNQDTGDYRILGIKTLSFPSYLARLC